MNQVGIVGRLTKDPTMRVMSEGRVHTSFIVAVSRNYKNQRGEVETDFVLCSTWGKPAHNVSKYCTKGSLVAVTGRLQSRHYDKEAAPKPLEPGSEADFDFQPPGTATVIST